MTPVKQNVLYAKDGIGNGNCFAACLASLLDLPLWMVPPFEQMFGRGSSYTERVDDWLRRFFKMKMVRRHDHDPSELPVLYIANGPSPRGVYHSVIYSNGELVHDPHYSDAGIKSVDWTWHLEPLA